MKRKIESAKAQLTRQEKAIGRHGSAEANQTPPEDGRPCRNRRRRSRKKKTGRIQGKPRKEQVENGEKTRRNTKYTRRQETKGQRGKR